MTLIPPKWISFRLGVVKHLCIIRHTCLYSVMLRSEVPLTDFGKVRKKPIAWHCYLETLSALLALCEGNPRDAVDSLHKGPVMQSLDIFGGWSNSRVAGGLRHHDSWRHSNAIWCQRVSSDILTHWGRVTHTCVGNLTIIGSDNGLSPGRRQAITWTNVGILLIGPLGTNFSEMLIEIHTFSFKKIHVKMSAGKWRHFVWASMC